MGYDNIPSELKKLNQWVVHREKIPYNPKSGYGAKAGDNTTWCSFQDAMQAVANYDGVGFEFATDGGITGIDFDHVLNPSTRDYLPGCEWAKNIIDELNTYTEISPSGTGLHAYLFASIPEMGRKRKVKNSDQAIEIYNSKRYFTVTGDVFKNVPMSERTKEVTDLCTRLFPKKETKSVTQDSIKNTVIESREYLKTGLEKDSKFKSLWDGERPNNNESSDDQALMNKLAYWCNREVCDMINAFKESPHYATKDAKHSKKADRDDYINMTAMKAVEDCQETASANNMAFQNRNTASKQKESQPSIKRISPISASELQRKAIPPLRFIVETLLPQGLNILASPPKYGKSWLMLALCLAVSSGSDFLKRHTNKCGCLYLALEDSEGRLQERMNKVLTGDNAPDNLWYSIHSSDLSNGLIDELKDFLKDHPDTGLIVIDTFQKIRGQASRSESAYSSDYKEMGQLKSFADDNNICLVLVHHLRKMKDDGDPFGRISGTNGISGAVDTMLVLDKNQRFDDKTTLSITGRDVDSNTFTLEFDKITCQWNFVGNTEDLKRQSLKMQYDDDKVVATIKDLLKSSPDRVWKGTVNELMQQCQELENSRPEDTAKAMSNHIKNIHNSLWDFDKIMHIAPTNPTKGKGRIHTFKYPNSNFQENQGEQLCNEI